MERRAFFKLAGISAASLAALGALGACDAGIVEDNPLMGALESDDASESLSPAGSPAVSFSAEVDVLIVGSGVAGLSAACLLYTSAVGRCPRHRRMRRFDLRAVRGLRAGACACMRRRTGGIGRGEHAGSLSHGEMCIRDSRWRVSFGKRYAEASRRCAGSRAPRPHHRRKRGKRCV